MSTTRSASTGANQTKDNTVTVNKEDERIKDLYLRIIRAKMEGEDPTIIQKMQQEYDRVTTKSKQDGSTRQKI